MILSFFHKEEDYFQQIIGHICFVIGIIIYNEIIIIKMCELDVNTEKAIKERATDIENNKMMVILPPSDDKTDLL